MQLIIDIHKVAVRVSNQRIEQLRMEEELLTSLVRNISEKDLKLKTEAFTRIKQINKMQLELLGEKL